LIFAELTYKTAVVGNGDYGYGEVWYFHFQVRMFTLLKIESLIFPKYSSQPARLYGVIKQITKIYSVIIFKTIPRL
jgi:hypothetical protein